MMMSRLSRYNHENSEKCIETKLLNLNGRKMQGNKNRMKLFFLNIRVKIIFI